MAEQLAQLLKTNIPAWPVGYKATIGAQEPFISRKEELQKGITGAEGDIAKATQAQAETRETGKLEAQKTFGAAEKGAMQQYQQKLEAEPLPAFIPTKDTAQDLAGLFSLVGVIGMIAGRGDAQIAMNSMNGMLEGYQKGRGDLYKKQATEFEKNFKSMLKKHEEFRKEMEDAVKLATTDKEAGMQAAELAAVKAGSDIVKAQLRKGDLVGAYKLVDETQKGVGEAVKAEAQIREKALDRQNQVSLEKLRAGLKNLKDALPMVQGVRGIENLQRQLADPEVQKGLLSKTAPLIEKIKSIADSTGDFESAVNKELTGTDKTTLFLKDALLESYNIERAAKGGQRLTVQDMKMVGPVLDPTNYSPQTYNQLLEGRRKVLYSNLQDVGYTPAMIQAQTAEKAYTPFNAPPATAKYTIGQEITKGNKKYRVVDLSDPNDPDLEEVK